ncbi:MAG: hypothetical protein LBD73_01400 [Deferribacteraceae bacterium]|nr:hypothetical protein [Deferribacteraceae bacterium]
MFQLSPKMNSARHSIQAALSRGASEASEVSSRQERQSTIPYFTGLSESDLNYKG